MPDTPDERALLLVANEQPDSARFSGDRFARLRQLESHHDPLDGDLRSALAPLGVEVERQNGLGSWTVRGPGCALDALRDPDGPLSGLPVHIVDDERYEAIEQGR